MGKNHILVFVSMLFMFLAKKCISISTRNNITDQEALLAFKAAITYDPQNLLKNNWTTNTSFRNWVGITCSNHTQRFRELNISGMGLVGTIPPQLGNLSFLWLMDVKGNQFHGYLPPELENLRRMQYLLFSYNNFTCTIQHGFLNMSSLVAIGFTCNSIHGNLPKNICDNLPNLIYLELSANLLSGQIPSGRKLLSEEFSNQSISLSTNYFVGEIPGEVGYLPMLRILLLGGNCLTGHIPRSIFNMTSIQKIDFSFNNLSGTTPSNVENVPNLQHLMLQYNTLTGHIPAILFLQDNFLSNDPSNPKLYFFTSLANCRALTRLHLANNLFSGILPKSIGNLTRNLRELTMDNNKLVGKIPSELGNLSSLIMLSLGLNNLSGAIPPTVARMGNLQYLFLSSNKLNGSIPTDLCNSSSLSEVYLLSGALPDCIGLLKSLRILALDANALSSSIPISSQLDVEFQLVQRLTSPSSWTNGGLNTVRFVGNIPSTLGQLKDLSTLFLWNNGFHGAIPESLGSLEGLEMLDPSSKNLSGNIPKSLEKLESLVYFNVSFNALEGKIPSGERFINLIG
ncbi:hypothetical protein Tsubulata_026769 [Turnera subulata]|uniref:Leucine-rich repeat-containing N-terminal plant-type domain-containing protein n=1 Tax=Turnera subulata TaxID=218843 RepID=A0A9Q0G6H3_9ROSI|nr:hypothetical protein Tsubulata_026769 [Turnera subulata]